MSSINYTRRMLLAVLAGALPLMCGSYAFVPPVLSFGLPSPVAPRACCSNAAVQARHLTAFLPPLARSPALAEQARPWRRCRRFGEGLSAMAGGGDGEVQGGFRVNKCFKEFASRRQSDRMVADGRVTVNGRVAGMGNVRTTPIPCI